MGWFVYNDFMTWELHSLSLFFTFLGCFWFSFSYLFVLFLPSEFLVHFLLHTERAGWGSQIIGLLLCRV